MELMIVIGQGNFRAGNVGRSIRGLVGDEDGPEIAPAIGVIYPGGLLAVKTGTQFGAGVRVGGKETDIAVVGQFFVTGTGAGQDRLPVAFDGGVDEGKANSVIEAGQPLDGVPILLWCFGGSIHQAVMIMVAQNGGGGLGCIKQLVIDVVINDVLGFLIEVRHVAGHGRGISQRDDPELPPYPSHPWLPRRATWAVLSRIRGAPLPMAPFLKAAQCPMIAHAHCLYRQNSRFRTMSSRRASRSDQ